jgi:two-component system, OmpR family, KDP operon response regulator KdpE
LGFGSLLVPHRPDGGGYGYEGIIVQASRATRQRRDEATDLRDPVPHAKPGNTILVIDSEPQIRRFLGAGLKLYGYSVSQAENGSVGLNAMTHIRPDLVILDPELPDVSGIEVLQTIRSWSNVPVIVLSIQAEEDHKVHFLRTGADDYMVKPFGIAELAARCEVALRRYQKAVDKDPVVRTGPLTINLVSRAVTLNSRYVTLTRQEYRLLHLLASHLGLVITHNQLIKDIWNDTSPENLQYLRSLVRKLRRKIEADPSEPKLLISESGVGYRLERDRSASTYRTIGLRRRWRSAGGGGLS